MRLAVLGCGKMGSALLRGILASPTPPASVVLYDPFPPAIESLTREFPFLAAAPDPVAAARDADVVLLCVKPHDLLPLADRLRALDEPQLVISIAAGIHLRDLEVSLHPDQRVLRVMPNTPALVGKGVSAVAAGSRSTPEDLQLAEQLLAPVGAVIHIPERLMDAVTGLSGSGPAYVFLVIEALADGGVRNGLPRAQALQLAAETVRGAAEMVLHCGLHPAELKDQVTSPGGTTIAALAVLEKRAVRSALIEAVTAAAQRSQELGA